MSPQSRDLEERWLNERIGQKQRTCFQKIRKICKWRSDYRLSLFLIVCGMTFLPSFPEPCHDMAKGKIESRTFYSCIPVLSCDRDGEREKCIETCIRICGKERLKDETSETRIYGTQDPWAESQPWTGKERRWRRKKQRKRNPRNRQCLTFLHLLFRGLWLFFPSHIPSL